MSEENNQPPDSGTGDQGGKDATYYQNEAKKAFEARQAAKREADELRKQLDALKGVDPEEYRTLKSEREAAEQERAKRAGEFDKLQQQLVTKHQAELTAEQQRREQAEQRLQRTVIGRAFADAVDLFGPSGKTIYLPSDAERIFGDRVQILEDGTVAVTDAAGDVILDGKTGKPAAFAVAMAEYIDGLSDKQYRLRGSGKTGSGSTGGVNGVPANQPIDVARLTPQQRRDPKVIEQLKANRPKGGMYVPAYDQ
jgi:hypothetical protein